MMHEAGGVTALDFSFGRNADGQVETVTDNASTGRGGTMGYSDAGRLTSASGPWGGDVYAYDAAGNRTSKARTVGATTTTETAVPATTSNRLDLVTDGPGGATLPTFAYRPGGDLSQDARAGGVTYDYCYNARKRLVLAMTGGTCASPTGVLGQYGYDAFGRRVWRSVTTPASATIHYIYDPQGHLLASTTVRPATWSGNMSGSTTRRWR